MAFRTLLVAAVTVATSHAFSGTSYTVVPQSSCNYGGNQDFLTGCQNTYCGNKHAASNKVTHESYAACETCWDSWASGSTASNWNHGKTLRDSCAPNLDVPVSGQSSSNGGWQDLQFVVACGRQYCGVNDHPDNLAYTHGTWQQCDNMFNSWCSVHSVSMWCASKPAREQCQDRPHCVKVQTGTASLNEGSVSLTVNDGDGQTQAATYAEYPKDSIVFGMCYEHPIHSVGVSNPELNAWTGSVLISSDTGATFSPITCDTCNAGTTTSSAQIVVDGNNDHGGQATTECVDGATCSLSPSVLHCAKVTTAETANSDGYYGLRVVAGGVSHDVPSAYYAQNQEWFQCFDSAVESVSIRGTQDDGWVGSIEVLESTTGATGSYNFLSCQDCDTDTTSSGSVAVDLDGNIDRAGATYCATGTECTFGYTSAPTSAPTDAPTAAPAEASASETDSASASLGPVIPDGVYQLGINGDKIYLCLGGSKYCMQSDKRDRNAFNKVNMPTGGDFSAVSGFTGTTSDGTWTVDSNGVLHFSQTASPGEGDTDYMFQITAGVVRRL